MPQVSIEYSPLNELEDESLEKLVGHDTNRKSLQRKRWYRRAPFLANILVLFVSITFFILSLQMRSMTASQCATRLSTFSPAQEALEYHRVRLNGTFDYPSIYRGHPNPELDAAWDRISQNVQPTRITKEVLEKIGKTDRPSLVKFKGEDGGGYMVSLEIFHQLHCLNMLRKFTYAEYYKPFDRSFQAKPEVFKTHLDHCVEMIRQNIMCNGDVGVITYDWVEGWSLPYPDFNTWHQCRNFDKILEWGYAHSVHIPRAHVTRFGHEVDLPVPP